MSVNLIDVFEKFVKDLDQDQIQEVREYLDEDDLYSVMSWMREEWINGNLSEIVPEFNLGSVNISISESCDDLLDKAMKINSFKKFIMNHSGRHNYTMSSDQNAMYEVPSNVDLTGTKCIQNVSQILIRNKNLNIYYGDGHEILTYEFHSLRFFIEFVVKFLCNYDFPPLFDFLNTRIKMDETNVSSILTTYERNDSMKILSTGYECDNDDVIQGFKQHLKSTKRVQIKSNQFDLTKETNENY